MKTKDFIEAIFGEALTAERRLVLWTMPDKLTMFFDSAADAVAYAGVEPSRNVYFGLGLVAGTPAGRGKLPDIAAIGCLWADIDFAGPEHPKPNLPADEAAATALLDRIGLAPSIVVHTGHGLQAYWLLKEPWIFETPEDRSRAATLSKRWSDTILAVAAAQGLAVDAVGDLTRLFRLPGSTNQKGKPVPVRILEETTLRYEEGDFEALLVEEPAREQKTPDVGAVDGLTLRAMAVAPAERLAVLIENDDTFRLTWERKRTDLQDQSFSSYDLALADTAVAAGWTDQEIANLIIFFRTRWGEVCDVAKALRQDYMRRTIAKARAGLAAQGVASGPNEKGAPEKGAPEKGAPEKITTDRLAAAILETEHFARDAGDRLYVYRGGVYRPHGARTIRAAVKRQCSAWGLSKQWTAHRAAETVEYIAVDCPELWEQPPLDVINVANGLLDVASKVLRPHSPDHLSPIQLPVRFDPEATCPAWEKFISETFPDDAQGLPWEVVAWLLTPDTSIQKAILLTGEGANGKSTFLAAVVALIGKANLSSVSLHKLESDRFATARLVGKLANISPDLPSTHLTGTSVFKALTGGDEVLAERKYGESFEFAPFARLIFSANHAPRSSDSSHAFFRRWLVVPFDRTFEEIEQTPRAVLDAQLAAPTELSGVLTRALAALPMTAFTESDSMRQAWTEFRETTDPVAVWLDTDTIEGPDLFTAKAELLRAFNASARSVQRPTMTGMAFGMAMKRLRPGIREGQRTVAGHTTWCWFGLGLRHPDGSSRASRASRASTIVNCQEKSRGREA